MPNDTSSQRTSQIVQRNLKCLSVLAGHEFNGLAPKAITERIGCTKSETTSVLRNLEYAGIAERVPGMPDRWRLGPKLIQYALAHLSQVDQTKKRYDEMVQRYSREFS